MRHSLRHYPPMKHSFGFAVLAATVVIGWSATFIVVANAQTNAPQRPLFTMSPTLVIDATLNLTLDTSDYRARLETAFPAIDWYSKETHVIVSGAGTNMKSPAYVLGPGAPSVSDYDPSIFINPFVFLDFSNRRPNAVVTVRDFLSWETIYGRIPDQVLVVFKFDYPSNVHHSSFPTLSSEVTDFLLNNRSIRGIGVDTPAADLPTSANYTTRALLQHGKLVVVKVKLDDVRIPATGAHIATLPSNIQGAPEAACRTIIYVDNPIYGPPLFTLSPTLAIDVSQPLTHTTPGDFSERSQYLVRNTLSAIAADGTGVFTELYIVAGGAGTHMDSSAHLHGSSAVIGGTAPSISEFAPDMFISPLALINITNDVIAYGPDTFVTATHVIGWEGIYGLIPQKAFVAMVSGWFQYIDDEKQYRSTDPYNSNLYHFPGFGDLAANFLVYNRSYIHGVGVDTLSGDYGATATYRTHYGLLDSGKYIVENMKFSDTRIPAAGAYIATFPSLIQGAPETACRSIVYV